jgi:hypothetical protein
MDTVAPADLESDLRPDRANIAEMVLAAPHRYSRAAVQWAQTLRGGDETAA